MRQVEPVYLYNAKPRGYYSESEINQVNYVEKVEYEAFRAKVKNSLACCRNEIQELFDKSENILHYLQYFEDEIKNLEELNKTRQRGGGAHIVVKKGRNTVNIKLR